MCDADLLPAHNLHPGSVEYIVGVINRKPSPARSVLRNIQVARWGLSAFTTTKTQSPGSFLGADTANDASRDTLRIQSRHGRPWTSLINPKDRTRHHNRHNDMPNRSPLTPEEESTLADRGFDKQQFGRWLKAERERRNLSQREAAMEIGVDRSTYIAWEHGQISPTIIRFFSWFLAPDPHPDASPSPISSEQFWRRRALTAEALIGHLRKGLTSYDRVRQSGLDPRLTNASSSDSPS